MGSTGDRPRKPRRRLARVSKYPDSSGNPVAGLTSGGGDGLSAPGESRGPSEHHHPLGRVGSGFLWLLGRRRTPMAPASEPVTSYQHEHEHEHGHEHGHEHEHDVEGDDEGDDEG